MWLVAMTFTLPAVVKLGSVTLSSGLQFWFSSSSSLSDMWSTQHLRVHVTLWDCYCPRRTSGDTEKAGGRKSTFWW